ncbi:MAG TPA: tetratricopeptide repeat protein [Bryobacteraceae bacterium]|nr:tetratricopeptide repeat protein [Bryobacteraceae bacterium]
MQTAIRLLSRWSPAFAHRLFKTGMRAYDGGDHTKAAKRFLPLAQNGNADAQFSLGVMYHNGYGFAKDDKEAARWLRLAAEQGHADGQFNLAVMYAQGHGLPQDHSEAAHWLRASARQGCAPAQFNLGISCRNGSGVPPDDYQAGCWLKFAADQGQTQAQINLGRMYLTGKFDPAGDALDESLLQGYYWLSLAAASGNADAVKMAEAATNHMTPEVISEAQRLAKEWKAKTRAESALHVYRWEVGDFFQEFNESPQNIPPTQAVEFLKRIDDLIDAGVMLGGAADDIVGTLRKMHHALAGEMAKAVPGGAEIQAEIDSLRELLRAPGFRQELRRSVSRSGRG